jgi:hypothetical protein
MWANRSICSYSDFNLAYVAEFQYKTGYARIRKEHYSSTYLLYSIIVQMIDFLVNCISAPYIIEICDFVKWRQYSKGT